MLYTGSFAPVCGEYLPLALKDIFFANFLLMKTDIEETSTAALFLKTRVYVVHLLPAQCNCKKALCSLHSSNLCQ